MDMKRVKRTRFCSRKSRQRHISVISNAHANLDAHEIHSVWYQKTAPAFPGESRGRSECHAVQRPWYKLVHIWAMSLAKLIQVDSSY